MLLDSMIVKMTSFLLLVFALMTGCVGHAAAEQPRDVSMVQLIADPARFDGQSVRFIGVLHLQFEGDAVYLHHEDFRHAIIQNSIAISLTQAQRRAAAKLNKAYVLVEGRFRAGAGGHLGLWQGTVQDVGRLGAWRVDRTRPVKSGALKAAP